MCRASCHRDARAPADLACPYSGGFFGLGERGIGRSNVGSLSCGAATSHLSERPRRVQARWMRARGAAA